MLPQLSDTAAPLLSRRMTVRVSLPGPGTNCSGKESSKQQTDVSVRDSPLETHPQ
jgi:hypothetical protein